MDLPLQAGDPFNRFIMQATADTITRRLRDRGYPAARVFTSFEANKEAETAAVTFDVVPGRNAVIGTVNVVGANRIEPQLVAQPARRPRPGRPYSQDELYQSQRNLYASDLFRFATVNIDSAKFQPAADSVPLLVQVSEARRRRIRGGLGYGTDDCFRGSLGWTTRNFLGSGGRILDLTSRISKVGVGRPFDWGLDREHLRQLERGLGRLGQGQLQPRRVDPAAGVPLAQQHHRRSRCSPSGARSSRCTSGRRPAPRSPSAARRPSAGSRCRWRTPSPTATPRPPPESFCASFNACTPDVVALLRQNRGAGHAHRERDRCRRSTTRSIPRAARCRRSSSPGARATSARARSSSSSATVADYSWYRPIARDVVFSWRVRGGAIFAPTVDVATQSGNFIPPEQRFYAGGPNDVRGFDRNELGAGGLRRAQGRGGHAPRSRARPSTPTRVTVAATGGNTLAVGNVELRVPVAGVQLAAPARRVRGRRRRLAARQRQRRPVIRVTPGVGHPARHAARARPARRGLQSVQAAGGHRSSRWTPLGELTPVPGQDRYVLGRKQQVHLPLRGGAGVLMRRRIARFFFVFLLGTVAMVLGVVTSMTLTPPGRNLLARTVSRALDRIVIGQVKVGAISGSFLYDLTLEDLVVRDTTGALLADLPRVRVTYRLPNLLAGAGAAEQRAARPPDHPAHQATATAG